MIGFLVCEQHYKRCSRSREDNLKQLEQTKTDTPGLDLMCVLLFFTIYLLRVIKEVQQLKEFVLN